MQALSKLQASSWFVASLRAFYGMIRYVNPGTRVARTTSGHIRERISRSRIRKVAGRCTNEYRPRHREQRQAAA